MDRINYAGDSLLTGSAIAHALLDYAQALSQAGASATVVVPVIDDRGERTRAEVLVGPASQLLATTVVTDIDEIVDDLLVARLTNDAVRLRRDGAPAPRAIIDDSDELQGALDDDY